MERTLVILKPDAIEKKVVGKIISRIENLGFAISQIQRRKISLRECQKLYPKTKERYREIFAGVVKYLTKNPSFILVVEGKGAVEKVQALRGPTELPRASRGTIRRDFVTGEERKLFKQGIYVKNVMHASGDRKEAEFEIGLFFGKRRG